MLKVKPLTKDQIIISIDRLTRFKNPETKYLRVFKDVIVSNLIEPKYKKSELDEMDYENLKNLAQEVINTSLGKEVEDITINEKLYDYECRTFYTDKNTEKLLKNKINYGACLELIKEDSPQNLKWLQHLSNNENDTLCRELYDLKFPIEAVIIVEGISEETLLPEFAKLCGYNFDKYGIYVISAGGKNQVVKLYYQLVETLKLPIFVLMDKDAFENYQEIRPRLRACDKVHLLECGEFEDVLPLNLVKKALSYGLNNISSLDVESKIENNSSMAHSLEEIFKHRGLHEFKKAEFAQMVKASLSCEEDLSDEIKEIIREIKNICRK